MGGRHFRLRFGIYLYDDASDLSRKTDARGVGTYWNGYDGLNRPAARPKGAVDGHDRPGREAKAVGTTRWSDGPDLFDRPHDRSASGGDGNLRLQPPCDSRFYRFGEEATPPAPRTPTSSPARNGTPRPASTTSARVITRTIWEGSTVEIRLAPGPPFSTRRVGTVIRGVSIRSEAEDKSRWNRKRVPISIVDELFWPSTLTREVVTDVVSPSGSHARKRVKAALSFFDVPLQRSFRFHRSVMPPSLPCPEPVFTIWNGPACFSSSP